MTRFNLKLNRIPRLLAPLLLVLIAQNVNAQDLGENPHPPQCPTDRPCVTSCDPTNHLELLRHDLKEEFHESKKIDPKSPGLKAYFDYLNKVRECQISNENIPVACEVPPEVNPLQGLDNLNVQIGARLFIRASVDEHQCRKKPGIKLKDGKYWSDGCVRSAVCKVDCDPNKIIKSLSQALKQEFISKGEISPDSEHLRRYLEFKNKVRQCEIDTDQVPIPCEMEEKIIKDLGSEFSLQVNLGIAPMYPENTKFLECERKPGILRTDGTMWGNGCDKLATCKIHRRDFSKGGEITNSEGLTIASSMGPGNYRIITDHQPRCKTIERGNETPANSERGFVFIGAPYDDLASVLVTAAPKSHNDRKSAAHQMRGIQMSLKGGDGSQKTDPQNLTFKIRKEGSSSIVRFQWSQGAYIDVSGENGNIVGSNFLDSSVYNQKCAAEISRDGNNRAVHTPQVKLLKGQPYVPKEGLQLITQ